MCVISILVPIYNVEKYLGQCLDSLINQTFRDIEIICINDGSTDSSLDILMDYSQKDSRIKIIDKANSGYGASMNCGIQAATGEYIGILESDDFAEPDMFEVLYDAARASRLDVIKADNYRCREGYSRSYYKTYPTCRYGTALIPRENPELFKKQSIWTGLYRKDFLINEGIVFNETPGASYQDISFNFKVMARTKGVHLVDKSVVNYRVDNPNSSIHSKSKARAIFDEFDEIRRFLDEKCANDTTLHCIMSGTEFYMCMGQYNIIGDEHRDSFLERLKNDIVSAEQLHYVIEKYWRNSDWSEKDEMLSDFEKYKEWKARETEKKKEAIKEFKKRLSCFEHIYIYGAGKVGDNVYDILAALGYKTDGFLVTKLSGDETIKRGLPVEEYNKCRLMEENAACLISVRDDDIDTILQYINVGKTDSILTMDSKMRRVFG